MAETAGNPYLRFSQNPPEPIDAEGHVCAAMNGHGELRET